jgi:tRNA(adenine34) deaminase
MGVRLLVIGICFCVLAGCTAPCYNKAGIARSEKEIRNVDSLQLERDNFYTLMAYAVVFKNWQEKNTVNKRGHNIGCVLVDSNNAVVYWARNCNTILQNGTQHGEVRVMLGYINQKRSYNLSKHTIYTSLEPCAQCAGMMTLQNIYRTVYGQKDPDFGDAFERLQCKSGSCQGCKPYPRAVISEESQSRYTFLLDSTYNAGRGTYNSITNFLLSDEAKKIYAAAMEDFMNYSPVYPQNSTIVKAAKVFFADSITTSYNKLNVDF